MLITRIFHFYVFLFLISKVKCDKYLEPWLFKETNGIHSGFNIYSGCLLVSIALGTPIFFIVHYFLKNYEEKKKEELELKKIEKKIYTETSVPKEQTKWPESNPNDTYGSLKEVIEKNPHFNTQLYATPAGGTCTSNQSSPRLHRSNSVNSNASFASSIPMSASETGGPVQKSTSFGPNHNNIRRLQHHSTISSSLHSSPVMERHRVNNGSSNQINGPTTPNTFLISQSSGIPIPIDPTDPKNNHILHNPPSPVLSTFGRSTNKSNPTVDSPVFSPSFFTTLKRTLSNDENSGSLVNSSSVGDVSLAFVVQQEDNEEKKNEISATLTNILNSSITSRPKSLTMSQNNSLITYLSSNTIPKDHWNCIVHRILELSASFWCPPKYDCQASLTSLNQIELALSGFSEQEQIKKKISTIDDQKYFSSIIFELHGKIFPLHEFIRTRNTKIEKDIKGVYGVFSILLPSLFNSFTKWSIDQSNDDQHKAQLESCKQNINENISSNAVSYKEKKVAHKSSIFNLIDYIRSLLFYSITKYNGYTLYKIVDKFHGIADDIDRILYQVDTNDFEQLMKPPASKKVFGLDQLNEQLLELSQHSSNKDQVEIHINEYDSDSELATDTSGHFSTNTPNSLFSKHNGIVPIINSTNSNPISTNTQVKSFEVSSPPLNHSGLIKNNNIIHSNLNEHICKRDGANPINNINIPSSIMNRFNHIENYLFSNNSTNGGTISIDLQKSIISSCYDHLQTCQNIFTSTEHFTSKFKSDIVPVIKLLLLTLQNLEDILETGISLSDLPTGEFLEFMTNYSKIATSLNNMILKNSAVVSNIKKDIKTSIKMSQLGNSSPSNKTPLNKSGFKPPSSPFGSPSLHSFISMNNPSSNGSFKSNLPSKRDRCLQIVQLSQDSIMIAILATLSLSYKDLKSTKYKNMDMTKPNEESETVVNYFKDSVGVFFSAIRTNIFCTYILLNPIYQL